MIFSGDKLFEMKATHGFPLEMALDRIINGKKLVVNWAEFIESARQNDWWDFQTYEVICHAMEDADISKDVQQQIKLGFQKYVLTHEHPRMKAVAQA